MKESITFCLLSFLFFSGLIVNDASAQNEALIDYEPWAKTLKSFVNEKGRVNYEGLKKNRGDLNRFIQQVEKTNVNFLSKVEQVTFWLNAYNAITLNVVTDKYPVKGIRRINFGLVWEVGRQVAQQKLSLGHIEHKILRPMGDPRVHFALNCASIGCPELPQEPFYPDRLEEQLERETKEFINNPEKVKLDRATNTLYYSEIFDWFEEDFLEVAPDILTYIKRYINEDDQIYLENNNVQLKVFKYDWGLNKQ